MWKNSEVPPTDANLNSISLEYTYPEIAKACRNFSSSCLLGKGSYGAVYRGILKDGTEVAIKVLNTPKDSGFKEEVLVLSKFRHPNLVILMGFSRNNRDRYLLYELLSGGDLCARLQRDPGFDWRKRLACCLDAALGLSHLHNATPKVFHRDIKTQNILLDRNGTAKMADFGLALLAQPREGGCTVEQCSGTIGYADPLYISSSVVTERSEVYSFGMVLLEVLTGRPPATQASSGQVNYTYKNISDWRQVMPLLQPHARWPIELAQRVIRLALACIDRTERNRPVFVDIVARLRNLSSRALTSDSTAYQVQAPVFVPPVPLLQANQLQLEEAFQRVSKKSNWNPFAIDEERSTGTSHTDESDKKDAAPIGVVPTPGGVAPNVLADDAPTPAGVAPKVELPKVELKEDIQVGVAENPRKVVEPQVQPRKSVVKNAATPVLEAQKSVGISSFVATFDEELRAMEIRKDASDVDRAMHALFPDMAETPEDPQRAQVAKHLLAAGFAVDQIKAALRRSSSVEAAVEWIVDQNWSTEFS